MRKEYYERIIEEFSKAIKEKGGVKGSSKTAIRIGKDGTLNGIRALMNRWYTFQELNGVGITVLVLYLGKRGRLHNSLRS